jgi:two-component system phosphate regulon sensor histidine kinase PhoR
VLQLARIERNRFRLQREPVQLNDVIAEAVSGARAKTEEAGGVFRLELSAPDRELFADRLHLTSAMAALLDNAIKYSPEKPVITVSTQKVGDVTRLIISDEGVGIALEHQDKVFEKFYRVPTGNVHDVKGFGLGLFYVRGVCAAHGYLLSIDQERSVGSAFRIDIPDRAKQDSFWRKLILRIFGPDKAPAWTQV